MRKGETLSAEQKAKMAAGRARQRREASSSEDKLVERIAARVLAAIGPATVARETLSPMHDRNDDDLIVEATGIGKPRIVQAPDYERPAAAVRALPSPPEPDAPAINPQVERTVALMETINPAIYDRTSASALLSAVRKLAERIGSYLQQSTPGPAELRCRICGGYVSPERPAAIRTVRNAETGLEENAFFDKSACALMWDSGRRTMTTSNDGGKGPMVSLD